MIVGVAIVSTRPEENLCFVGYSYEVTTVRIGDKNTYLFFVVNRICHQ